MTPHHFHHVLIEHIKRSFFISTSYKNASLPNPSCGMNPLDHGWDMDISGRLMIRWFEGEQVPGDIEDLVGNIDIESDDDLYHEEEDNNDNGENWP